MKPPAFRYSRTLFAFLLISLVAQAPAMAKAGEGRPSPSRPPACAPAWARMTTPNASAKSFLYGIDGVSANDVWAVGEWADEDFLVQTLVEHWNGSAWSVVPSPNVGGGTNGLRGVTAVSPSAAWAVGETVVSADGSHTLVERWNGSAWVVEASPNVGPGDNVLTAVSASSASDVWAVGSYLDAGTETYRTLAALHRNGTAWSVVPTPNVGTAGSYLTGVTARTPSDAWAVGHSIDVASGRLKTLVMRWNGTAWRLVPSPNPSSSGDNVLSSVAASSSTAAWAVGYQRTTITQNLALRWNGSAWSATGTPNPGSTDNSLSGVAAIGGADVFAVGTYSGGGVRHPAAQHWDGTSWRTVSTPTLPSANSGYVNNVLASASAIDGQVWAAGLHFESDQGNETLAERICPVRVLDSGFSPSSGTVRYGETVSWSFPPTNAQSHSIADDSGLVLFASGTRGPGSSYAFDYIAGGSYPVVDRTTGKRGTIKVNPGVTPASGGTGTQFTVTWSSASAPSGYVFDSQIKRPGSSQWSDWKVGKTGTSSTFVPDSGQGKYSFRSRMRTTSNGAASGWSPAVSVQVN